MSTKEGQPQAKDNPFKGSHPVSKLLAMVYDLFGYKGVAVLIVVVVAVVISSRAEANSKKAA